MGWLLRVYLPERVHLHRYKGDLCDYRAEELVSLTFSIHMEKTYLSSWWVGFWELFFESVTLQQCLFSLMELSSNMLCCSDLSSLIFVPLSHCTDCHQSSFRLEQVATATNAQAVKK